MILHFLMRHNPFLFRWCFLVLDGGDVFESGGKPRPQLWRQILAAILASNPGRNFDGKSRPQSRRQNPFANLAASPSRIDAFTYPDSSLLQWCSRSGRTQCWRLYNIGWFDMAIVNSWTWYRNFLKLSQKSCNFYSYEDESVTQGPLPRRKGALL